MNKGGWVVSLITLIILGFAGYAYYKLNSANKIIDINESAINEGVCNSDQECVPDLCCHASNCALKSKAPDCSITFCTQECRQNSLDCGNGECKCINNKCKAFIK